MLNRLRKFVPIKPGEGFVTAVMFSYIFGVLCFYYILDPIRKGLFLNNFPSSELPYAYFLTAIIAGTIATLAFKLSSRWSVITLVTVINVAIIGTLFYFRWAMSQDLQEQWYLAHVYFFYMKTISVLSTAQFWLLAGCIYDSRQAKRIYGLLGLAAILGAIVGSAIPAFFSKRLSLSSMVLIAIVVCALLVLLSHVAWRHRRKDADVTRPAEPEKPRESFADIWPTIFRSSHLRMMSMLIFCTLIASQIADWQVDDAAQKYFQRDKEDIQEFTGRLSFATNILALTVQALLTYFVVHRLGVLAAILVLPAFLFLSSGGFLLLPGLLMASIARGSDSVFRYSLNRAGLEMLYLPLAPALRSRLKLFVDVFVDRAGRAIAGVLILLFVNNILPYRERGTAAAAMVLTLLSLIACFRLGRTYVQGFRQQLIRREVELEDVTHYVSDPAAVQMLVGALDGANERQILYALRLLQSVSDVDFSARLLPLLQHPSPHVREEAVRTLQSLPQDHRAAAARLLHDTAENVRIAAAGYICSSDPKGPEASLRALLQDGNPVVRIAAARWAAANPVSGFQPSLEFIHGLCAIGGTHAVKARVAAAALCTQLPADAAVDVLKSLMRDQDPEVAAAAAKAAGTAGLVKLAFDVASMLATAKGRRAGRAGLLCYGERAVGTVGDLLRDPGTDAALRRELPWVLSRIPVQESIDLLSDQLTADDSLIRFRSVKALNRLHETDGKLKIPAAPIERAIHGEVQSYYRALAMTRSLKPGLLQRALQERMDQSLEIVFRLLGLKHSQKDIYFAYLALKEKRPDRKIAAIEFLDNVLGRSLKPLILPLLEESSLDALRERGRKLFGIQDAGRDEALGRLLTQNDAWLKSCALHEIGESRIREFAESCRTMLVDANPVVKETAAWAIARCAKR